MVPKAGLEPARGVTTLDFESSASANSATAAYSVGQENLPVRISFFMLPYPVTFFNYFFMILFVFYLQSFFPTSKQSNVAK